MLELAEVQAGGRQEAAAADRPTLRAWWKGTTKAAQQKGHFFPPANSKCNGKGKGTGSKTLLSLGPTRQMFLEEKKEGVF